VPPGVSVRWSPFTVTLADDEDLNLDVNLRGFNYKALAMRAIKQDQAKNCGELSSAVDERPNRDIQASPFTDGLHTATPLLMKT
jgi:hypothetical protein